MVLIYIKETINHVIGFCLDPSSHAYVRNDFPRVGLLSFSFPAHASLPGSSNYHGAEKQSLLPNLTLTVSLHSSCFQGRVNMRTFETASFCFSLKRSEISRLQTKIWKDEY